MSLAKKCQEAVGALAIWSPFAFAHPSLEQQYQAYHSAHVGYPTAGLCAVTLLCWATKALWTGGEAWMLYVPISVCTAVLLLIAFRPQMYRKYWQECSFAYQVAHSVIGTGIHKVMIRTSRQSFDQMTVAQVFMMEHARATIFWCIVIGAPLNLPACMLAESVFFATQDSFSSWYCDEVPFARRPVSFAFQILLDAGMRQATIPSMNAEGAVGCRVRMVFWQVQAVVFAAGGGLLRDVFWRRAFLASNQRLLGPNGAQRAARWPLGSMHTLTMCFTAITLLIMFDALLLDVAMFFLINQVGLSAGALAVGQ